MATAPQKIDLPKKPKACSVIPSIKPFTIPVPFGAELKAITDPSKGPPNDCAIVHSLMLQLMPMLSGFACILKILNVLTAIKKIFKTTPPFLDPGAIFGSDGLISSIGKLADCIPIANPVPWIHMIKGILQLILAYIGCLIQGFESIRNFKVGIDLNAEGGTPLLLNTLDCAKGNADTSLAALMDAMGPIEPLLQLIEPITSIIGIDLSGLSLSGGSSGDDPLQPIIDFHDKLSEIVDSLP
ncbi:MAG: hypothetical protein JWM08_1242 [Candidatus Angelobacter sp.]|jgi:hypothetical protein|nr:hypothetical protein [Candidatus Angelobacter sp.]MCU1332250.1 hypothetical protein [Candidatus Angelobacter sp.]